MSDPSTNDQTEATENDSPDRIALARFLEDEPPNQVVKIDSLAEFRAG